MKKFILLALLLTGCKMFEQGDFQGHKMDPDVNYFRDMIICANGFCKTGSLTMPLLDVNEIRVISPGPLDLFLTTACGGKFPQQNAGNVKTVQKSFWSKKEVNKSNEAVFTIKKTDFHELGKICPLYFSAIANNGKNSDGYLGWQTEDFKLSGQVICQMEKRVFEGVEVCDTGSQSFTKVIFDEEVRISHDPDYPQCAFGEAGTKVGREFTWKVASGECNYAILGEKSNIRGVYTTYGADEVIVR